MAAGERKTRITAQILHLLAALLSIFKLRWLEHITYAADRMDELGRKILVHFTPDAMHENIHHVGLRIETVVPHVFENHGLRHDTPGVAHEKLEQRKLSRLKLDAGTGARDFARNEIEGEICHREPGWFSGVRRAANQGLHAGEQFGKRKRLYEIIVAAGLQPAHAIIDRGLRA